LPYLNIIFDRAPQICWINFLTTRCNTISGTTLNSAPKAPNIYDMADQNHLTCYVKRLKNRPLDWNPRKGHATILTYSYLKTHERDRVDTKKRIVRPLDAVEGKNRRRFVCCCYSVAMEKEADETRSNGEVPWSDNLLNHSNVAVPIKNLIREDLY
jgi:hypothetical protein